MTFKECKYLIKSDLNRLTKVKWGGGGGKRVKKRRLVLGFIHLSGEKVMQAGVKVKYPEPFRAWAPHGGIPDFFARTGFGASLYWLPLWQHRIFIIRILFPWKRTTPNTVSSRQTM